MLEGASCKSSWRHSTRDKLDPAVFGQVGLPVPDKVFNCITDADVWKNRDSACPLTYSARAAADTDARRRRDPAAHVM